MRLTEAFDYAKRPKSISNEKEFRSTYSHMSFNEAKLFRAKFKKLTKGDNHAEVAE